MNDKKNLDRLFQEKFKDFEAEPDEQVWRNIEDALRKKKKKRVIPIWYRLSGVAAALIIGALIFNSISGSDINVPQNNVVLEDNNKNEIEKTNGVATEKDSKKDQDQLRSSEENRSNTNVKNSLPNVGNDITNSEDAIVSSEKESGNSINKVIRKQSNAQNAIVNQSGKNKNSRNNSTKNSGIATDTENAVAAKNKKSGKRDRNRNLSGKNSINENETGIAASGSKQAKNSDVLFPKPNTSENKETSIATNSNNKSEQKNTIENSTNIATVKSGTDAIASVEIKELDSAAIATVEPNALEELLTKNEKEKNVIAETKLNRWQITPQVAPIYFGSTSEGSPIDEQFSSNNKSYEKNLSYGVAVNYAISKKLNVRTGINKLTLGYNTNGVSFAAGLNGRNFENIGMAENLAGIQIISSDLTASLLPFETSIQSIKTGSISQTMGYIEVPMELSYKLIDKKFGINLIGGVSTLFLDENTVSISSSDVSASLGKANNLNDVHFSSNFGVGFKYSFWKSFEFNFEPTLKYQINTFSKNAGDFKPYFIGLYSGVSFRF